MFPTQRTPGHQAALSSRQERQLDILLSGLPDSHCDVCPAFTKHPRQDTDPLVMQRQRDPARVLCLKATNMEMEPTCSPVLN